MPQIRLLDQATVNKIAAGEVVERPASIVKEMVENAIDAGANKITVEIRDGGIGLIRITDNGCGIESEQIRTAFLRHSTSKIRKVEDLLSSTSLGFRGEALASIAAVARVEMITRPATQYTGTRFVIEGGVEQLSEEIACPVGTTIRVENLFFNTPARKKFLKKPAAEAAAITDLIQKMAMGHPEVAFRYLNGKKEPSLLTPGTGSLKNDIFAVYGKDIVDKLIPVQGKIPLSDNSFMEITGFISRPQLTRANRSYENFFINGRYIRSSLLEKGIDEAYKDYIVPGTFPAVVLHLSMDPSTLDVNVHPTKMEVRFFQEDRTRFGLYHVISEALRQQDLVSRVGDFYRPSQKPTINQTPAQAAQSNQPDAASGSSFTASASNPASDASQSTPVRKPVFTRELTPVEKTIQSVLPADKRYQAPVFAGRAPRGAVKANDLEVVWPAKKSQDRPILAEETAEPLPISPAETAGQSMAAETAEPLPASPAEAAQSVSAEPTQPMPAEPAAPAAEQPEIKIYQEEFPNPVPTGDQIEIITNTQTPEPRKLRIVGQIFRTYWIAEEKDVFYIVDQHAAHERVLYDQYRAMLNQDHMDTQELMEPVVVTVNAKAVADLDRYQPVLKKLGYIVESFGDDAVIVRGVPFLFGKALPAEDMARLMDMLFDGQVDTARDLLIDKIATMSCKAAVKGNDALSFAEAQSLLDQLFASANPYNCPHGRPTLISVTQYELEKRFKRV